MRHFFKLLLLIIVFNSCEKEKRTIKEDIYKIDILEALQEKEKIKLSSIASKIEYISLQKDSNLLIGRIQRPEKNIQFHNNRILINDDISGELSLYDYSGSFLNKIGNRGQGPEEYAKVNEFTVLKTDNDSLIAIFSAAQQKTLLYDFDSTFLKEFNIGFWPVGLTSVQNNLIFINSFGRRKESDYYNFSIVTPKGDLRRRLLYKANEKNIEQRSGKELGLRVYNNYYRFKDTLSFWESNYDTIWRITNDFTMLPKYFLDIGDNKMPFREQTEQNLSSINRIGRYNSIEKCQESTRYIFTDVLFEKRKHTILFDKRLKKARSIEFKRPFDNGIHFAFYNDIDGGMPFWPMGKISDDKMFMLTYGHKIKDYMNRKGIQFDAIRPKSREWLLNLVENSEISDNPILMVVTLKK